MSVSRIGIGLVGTLIAVYGVWLLVSRQSPDQLSNVAIWLIAGVVLHDALLSGLIIGLGAIGARLPRAVGAAAVTVLVVVGSITIVALPALVHAREPQANPTLLPRDYPLGWVIVALIVTALSAVVGWTVHRRTAASLVTGSMD